MLRATRSKGERGQEAWTLRILAEILGRSEPPDYDAAEAHYLQAMEITAALGMRPLVAHCHAGLSKLYRRTGKRDQAQENLTTATTMYRDMDMRFWLEQTEADPDT